MAICYDRNGDNKSVIDFTTKAINTNPNYLKPYLNRAEKYVLAERYDEALTGNREGERIYIYIYTNIPILTILTILIITGVLIL